MADFYGTPWPPPSNPHHISTYLRSHRHNASSSTSASSCMSFNSHFIASTSFLAPQEQLPSSEDAIRIVDSDCNAYPIQEGFLLENIWATSDVTVRGAVDYSYFWAQDLEAPEAPSNPPPPRSSSKRNRSAEVHNLSEKTDKVSMLDEAIEYLKQLQLQVQVLYIRNGLSLHPMCMPEIIPSVQPPLVGTVMDEIAGLSNSNEPPNIIAPKQETSMRTEYSLPNLCTSPSQLLSNSIAPFASVTDPERTYGLEPSVQVPFEQLSIPTSNRKFAGKRY